MRRIFLSIVLLGLLPFSSKGQTLVSPANLQWKTRSKDAGFALGILTSNDIKISPKSGAQFEDSVRLDATAMLKVFYDHYLSEHWSVGGYLNFAPLKFLSFDTELMYEAGGSLKYRFLIGKRLATKIGAYMGFRTYTSLAGFGSLSGLATDLSIELQYNIYANIIPYFELGFLAQPAGSNQSIKGTFGPVPYFLAGIAF